MKAREDLVRLGDIPVCTSLRGGEKQIYYISVLEALIEMGKCDFKKCAETFKTMGNTADTLT